MQISARFQAPATPPARPTKVTDVQFDFGTEYYNAKDGSLQERPATKGFLRLNKTTLEAADQKIAAIQNRVQDLNAQGVQADAQGNFHYEDKSGEVVDVKKDGNATVYSQSLPLNEMSWFKRDKGAHIETFRVDGNEVSAAVTDKHDAFYSVFGLPVSKHETSELTQSWKYKHSPEGLQYFHSDKWTVAQ
ncbi:hypothetical protein ABS71_20195 [bacterium SCN 62-11]|nr:hypothetical protein [Candidatus Eremiobacteraeota bacterium]ODT57298.1 MAG: hypothetical protein ABS71_20195 [bacterium SCN 62-11]